VALSRVIQLFIAIFGHKTAEGDDEMGEGDRTPKAGSALVTDPAKPDLERRYAHHRTPSHTMKQDRALTLNHQRVR
jgi:hypothetical protein